MLRASAPSVSKVAAYAIPFIIAPTGTMANNGVITVGTALPTTYANAYIFLPASAISAGSAAGWYFCQMSSTTVGTVFNNTYTSGIPTIPASPTSFVTTGPGAYTGVTAQTSGPQISIPGGSLGPNGVLRTEVLTSYANTAGSKTLTVFIVGAFNLTSTINANVNETNTHSIMYARGSQSSQVSASPGSSSGLGSATATPNYGTANFANAQTLAIAGTLATATDFIVIEAFTIEILPG